MRARIRLTALILGILTALGLASKPITAAMAPNSSYTLDEAGALSEKTKDYITERNYNLEANCQGAQICVIVLKSIGSDRIEEYAADIFEKRRIGRQGEDNGVLLLMAVENENYHILAGSRLSSVMTSETLSDVIRNNIEPFFCEGDYDGAAKEAVRKLNEIVCRFYGADPAGYAAGGSGRRGGSGCSNAGLSCACAGGAALFGCTACLGCGLLGGGLD